MQVARQLPSSNQLPWAIRPTNTTDDRRYRQPRVILTRVLDLTVLMQNHHGPPPDAQLAINH